MHTIDWERKEKQSCETGWKEVWALVKTHILQMTKSDYKWQNQASGFSRKGECIGVKIWEVQSMLQAPWNQRLTSCHQTQADFCTSLGFISSLGHHFQFLSVFLFLELPVINLMFVPEQPELIKRVFHPETLTVTEPPAHLQILLTSKLWFSDAPCLVRSSISGSGKIWHLYHIDKGEPEFSYKKKRTAPVVV